MEFLLRDVRHLKGTTPRVDAPRPTAEGLAVDSGWWDGTPYLTVRAADGTTHVLRLDGTLNLEVRDPRRCVGRYEDGRWTPCPDANPADRFDQCPRCHPLPNRDCVFNPNCADCTDAFCRSPHRLYLAFYGELPKVGMTRATRGDARLVEQGADAFAVIGTVDDRAEARRLEDRVTARLGIPQARRSEELLSRVARPVPWTAIENAYDALRPRLGALTGMPPGPLERLAEDDGPYPLPAVPTLAGVVGHHAGEILGVKGRYLFYRVPTDGDGGVPAPIWALNVSAVVTHEVCFDPQAPHLS